MLRNYACLAVFKYKRHIMNSLARYAQWIIRLPSFCTSLAVCARSVQKIPPRSDIYFTVQTSRSVSKRLLFSFVNDSNFGVFQHRFATALVYYGLSYGSVDLGGNRYLNFFLVNVGDLPATIALFWSVKRYIHIDQLNSEIELNIYSW